MNTHFNEFFAGAVASALNNSKHPGTSENPEEIHQYFNKLKDLVPACPKNTPVSKLEVIQHVIDYIGDLQDTLHSDSETESSPPESPMDDVNFTDGFTQSLQLNGYGAHPQLPQQQQQFQYVPQSSNYGYSTMDACSNGALSDGYGSPITDDYNKPLQGFENGFSSGIVSSTAYDSGFSSSSGFRSSSGFSSS